MNDSYIEELKHFCEIVDMDILDNKKVLITGASGLIGSYLVDVIMHSNLINNNGTYVYAMVRNKSKAYKRFKKYKDNPYFHLIQHDISEPINFEKDIDYIIHAASNANPTLFDEDPIGTITSNVYGTVNLLKFAKNNNVSRTLFISSSEIYGEPVTSNKMFNEGSTGIIDPLSPRSCYTESKRMAENICVNYHKQFNVDTLIARVGFAYGSTFTSNDNRVIPQFVNNALMNKDIVLKSTGGLVRSYIYLFDVISGLIVLLAKGKTGEAYNIANKDSNVSIREIAETIAKLSKVNVVYELPGDITDKGYSPFSVGLLDATKLEDLGWKPKFDIKTGISQVLKNLI